MIRNLTNIGTEPLSLTDFNGKVVEVGETFDGQMFGEMTLRNSNDIALNLLNGKLKLSDGALEYLGSQAIDVLKGLPTQMTRDGKPITTVSDRPKDHYRCFSGRGDDLAENKIGLGPDLVIHIPADQHTSFVDCKFVDNVYIRDGSVVYQNAPFDTTLCCDVICPAGVPFPHPTRQGTLDFNGTTFVPNATGAGEFTMNPAAETILFKFINNLHLLGTGKLEVNSPEPFLLNKPYFLRFSACTPEEPQEVGTDVAINIGMFRKKTV